MKCQIYFSKGYSSLLSVKTFKILSTIKWINCGGIHLKIIEFRGFPQHQTSGDIFNWKYSFYFQESHQVWSLCWDCDVWQVSRGVMRVWWWQHNVMMMSRWRDPDTLMIQEGLLLPLSKLVTSLASDLVTSSQEPSSSLSGSGSRD